VSIEIDNLLLSSRNSVVFILRKMNSTNLANISGSNLNRPCDAAKGVESDILRVFNCMVLNDHSFQILKAGPLVVAQAAARITTLQTGIITPKKSYVRTSETGRST